MSYYSATDQCPLCKSGAEMAFENVSDGVYGVPGEWNLRRCSSQACGAVYLDAQLMQKEVASFYTEYSTHAAPVTQGTRGLKAKYQDAIAYAWMKYYSYPRKRRFGLISRLLGGLLHAVPYFRQVIQRRVFWLEGQENGRVAEIGFGNAATLIRLKSLGWKVAGLEMDQHCVEAAKQFGVDARLGAIESGLLEPGGFDAIAGSHVIEHVPDPKAFTSAAFDALKPGGKLILVTPNCSSIGARFFGESWRGLEVPRHLVLHSPESLNALLEEEGFDVQEIFPTSHSGFIWQQSVELQLGRKVSPRQNLTTVAFNLVAALIYIIAPKKSDEIVAIAQRPIAK